MHEKFRLNLSNLKDRTGMYVIDESYKLISTFITGMDFQANGQLLDGFHSWLQKKYKVRSPRAWEFLLEDIFFDKKDKINSTNLKDFMFENIIEFLDSK